jgi:hypothetical protein
MKVTIRVCLIFSVGFGPKEDNVTTVNLPLTVLGPGTYTFGPYPVADADTQATLSVDRTPGNGLNTRDGNTVMLITLAQSDDDGGSWTVLNTGQVLGGQFSNTSQVNVPLLAATGRTVRCNVSLTGQEVAIAGSFVSS